MKLTIVLLLLPLRIFAIIDWTIDRIGIASQEWSTTNITGSGAKRVYQGREVNIYSAPYMALVYADDTIYELPFCSAVIITTRHLISTAYFFKRHEHKDFKVIAGYTSPYPIIGQTSYEVKKVYIHERYFLSEIYNDIALLELRDLLPLSPRIKLIKLATLNETIYTPVNMRIMGFGLQTNGRMGRLVEKEINIVNHNTINFTDRVIVIKEDSFRNCYGDSGSSGVVNGNLTALMIFQSDCNGDMPKFFTGIPYYYEWIKNYVGAQRLEKYPDLN